MRAFGLMRLPRLAAAQAEREFVDATLERLAARNRRAIVQQPLAGYHTARVHAVALSADGARALTGADDGAMCAWNSQSGSPLALFAGHPDMINAVALSGDGRFAAAVCADGAVRTRNLDTGAAFYRATGAGGEPRCAAFSDTGALLVAGTLAGGVQVWRSEDAGGARVHDDSGVFFPLAPRREPLETNARASVTAVVLTTQALFAAGTDGRVAVCAPDGTAVRARFTTQTTADGAAHMPLLSAAAGEGTVAGAAADGLVYLWDVASGALKRTVRAADDAGDVLAALPPLVSAALSADAQVLAAGDGRGVVRVWDLRAGQRPLLRLADAGGLAAVALSADGRTLLRGGAVAVVTTLQ